MSCLLHKLFQRAICLFKEHRQYQILGRCAQQQLDFSDCCVNTRRNLKNRAHASICAYLYEHGRRDTCTMSISMWVRTQTSTGTRGVLWILVCYECLATWAHLCELAEWGVLPHHGQRLLLVLQLHAYIRLPCLFAHDLHEAIAMDKPTCTVCIKCDGLWYRYHTG